MDHSADAGTGQAAQVSIIVAGSGEEPSTLRLLLALLDTAAEAPGGIEVIIVDEASSSDLGALGDTLAAMTWYFGIRTVLTRNDPPLGFGGANDAAIRLHARGEYVLLLNNDAVPLPGWLFAFLTTFREHSRIPGRQPGLVGPMFLGEAGVVSESGRVIASDGTAVPLGSGSELPQTPAELLFARPVDSLHPGCVMLRRDVYLSLGAAAIAVFAGDGTDGGAAPGAALSADPVYAVAHLAMAARAAGLQAFVQPAAGVILAPASGTAEVRGGSEEGRAAFSSLWNRELHESHVPSGMDDVSGSMWARLRPLPPLARSIRDSPAALALLPPGAAASFAEPGAVVPLFSGASTFSAPVPPVRALFIDATVPQPDRDSGSVRLYWLLRILVEQGVAVDFMPDWNEEMKYVTRMRLHGVHVLPARPVTNETMEQLLLYSDAEWSTLLSLAEREPKAQPAGGASLPPYGKRTRCRYDIFIVARHGTFTKFVPILRWICPSARLVFDTVDLHFLREARLAISDANTAAIQQRTSGAQWSFQSLSADAILTWLRNMTDPAAEAVRLTMGDELHHIAAADVTVVVSTEEVRIMEQLAPSARVVVVSNVQDTEDAPPAPSPCNADGKWAAALPAIRGGRPKGKHVPARRHGVLFVGSLNHTPNPQAIAALLSEIMPIVWAQEPTIPLHVVGADLGPDNLRDKLTQRAAASNGTFVFHGRLSDDDLTALYRSVAVAAAPLFSGAGVKGKVNQAMKLGTPVVATPLAVEGMRMVEGVTHLQAASAQAFADAILRLHADCSLWHSLSTDGRESFAKHFSVQAGTGDVITMLAAALE